MVQESACVHWMFTLWCQGTNMDPLPIHDNYKYMVQQLELSKDGKPHWQGYIALNKKQRLNAIKKYMPNHIHLEKVKSSPQLAYNYCTKIGDHLNEDGTSNHELNMTTPGPGGRWVTYAGDAGPLEHGTLPKGSGERTDIQQVVSLVQSGANKRKLWEDAPDTMVKHYRGFYEMMEQTKVQRTDKFKVIVLYGDTNVGKSHYVNTLGTQFTVPIDSNKPWFDGYEDEEVIHLEEFNGQFSLNWLKQFLDNRKCRLPVKGSYKYNNAKYICITSNTDPRDWYKDIPHGDWLALSRRFDMFFCVRGLTFEDCTYYKDNKGFLTRVIVKQREDF